MNTISPGTKEMIAKKKVLIRKLKVNSINIFNNVWPAIRFENNLIAKLKIRAKYDINSIKISNMEIKKGAP